jgi:hypothetical protein
MSDAVLPRKYLTELALNLHTSTVIMIPPDQLHRKADGPAGFAEAAAECHIYLICRRLRLSFDPNTFKLGPEIAEGHFVRRVDGKEERIAFRKKIGAPEGGRVEVGPYPHRELIGFNALGEPERVFPATVLVQQTHVSDDTVRDFEVMYVGQAFGEGDRSALDRLRAHATLQKILAELSAGRPDDEVMLFLVKYEPAQFFASIDGITKSGIGGEADTEHFLDVMDNPLSEKQEIAIAEAGLIRYFAPEYNEKYKASFPDEDHKILEDCYKLDFAGLVVEINTEDVLAPLWSPNTKGKVLHHIANFDLHDLAVRRSFFSFVDKNGKYALMNDSGPVY